jgi:hypothetical protein
MGSGCGISNGRINRGNDRLPGDSSCLEGCRRDTRSMRTASATNQPGGHGEVSEDEHACVEERPITTSRNRRNPDGSTGMVVAVASDQPCFSHVMNFCLAALVARCKVASAPGREVTLVCSLHRNRSSSATES